MSEAALVLSYALATLVALAIGGLGLFATSRAKERVIREQLRALAAEQRLRRAQEAFTDNAHHELRTPIQILRGHLDMLQETGPAPEQAILLARAQAAVARLDRLIQDLLDLSALAQGTFRLDPQPSDLGVHLSALADRFRRLAAQKQLTLRVDLPPLPAPLLCDSPTLIRALEALMDNAVGFSPSGALAFRVQASPEGPDWRISVDVEDQGPGLPPDWERLLRPFEQGETGFRRTRGGLGVGLPLASGLVALMGGHLTLVPQAQGTLARVEVRLPEAPVS